MKIPCGMCGRDKPRHSMIAAEDGLLICARCHREYKDLEEDPAVDLEERRWLLDRDIDKIFEDAT